MAFIQLQFRRDTSTNWTSYNPTLASGELGIETDTFLFKLGDGATAWNTLAYGGLQGIQGIQGIQGTTGATGATGATGSQGIQGIQGIQGTTGATGAAGTNGTDGANGLDGKTILNGVVAPTTQGVDGDFYIDTATSTIYGPKATTWPAGVSLVGAQGAQGIQGTTGATGAAGTNGTDGLGVPAGGATGTVLTKVSATDNDTTWAAPAVSTTLTTKGDLQTFDTANARLGVGTDAFVLTADSTQATGLKWAAAAGGAGSNTYKEAVRVATIAAGTLASSFQNASTVDSVSLVTGNRILIKNQTTASENGIYTVNASGAPTRATDFDTNGAEISNGAVIPVQFGTRNGGSTWQLVTNGGTIGNSFVFSPLNLIAVQGISAATAPTSSGTNAIAIGNSSTASGTSCVSIGSTSNSNSGNANIAIGNSANCSTGGQQVVIGSGASISGVSNNAIAIGQGAFINTAADAIAIGNNSYSNGINGVALGKNVEVLHNGAVALGGEINTDFIGHCNFGNAGFATKNDAMLSFAKFWATTTSATPAEVGINITAATTPTNRLVLTSDSSYIFDCDIVARNTATDAESAMYNLKFGIRRGTNAASTTLVGTPVLTVIGEDTGTTAWDVAVTADTTNGRPNISVTGEAAKTIRWVANIRMTKVSG